ncbi:Os03g0675000, partial [Oryza sativa Japonica Group]
LSSLRLSPLLSPGDGEVAARGGQRPAGEEEAVRSGGGRALAVVGGRGIGDGRWLWLRRSRSLHVLDPFAAAAAAAAAEALSGEAAIAAVGAAAEEATPTLIDDSPQQAQQPP